LPQAAFYLQPHRPPFFHVLPGRRLVWKGVNASCRCCNDAKRSTSGPPVHLLLQHCYGRACCRLYIWYAALCGVACCAPHYGDTHLLPWTDGRLNLRAVPDSKIKYYRHQLPPASAVPFFLDHAPLAGYLRYLAPLPFTRRPAGSLPVIHACTASTQIEPCGRWRALPPSMPGLDSFDQDLLLCCPDPAVWRPFFCFTDGRPTCPLRSRYTRYSAP